MKTDTQDTTVYQALANYLHEANYSFVCPSPESQGRVVRKRCENTSTVDAKNVHDFFGWSLSCSETTLRSIIPHALVESLQNAKIITPNPDGKFRATIRVSNFYLPTSDIDAAPLYYIHSSFPAASDAVFFGPDTYLFVSFLQTIKRHFSRLPKSIIDVCCGSGAGAIHLARTFPWANVIGLDLNARALQLGGVNAHLADVTVEFHKSNLYDAVPDTLKSSGVDLIVSNPPYIASSSSGEDLPIYADGGAGFGLNMSLRIVEEGLKILKEKGILVVYAGVAIPIADPGRDAFLKKLESFEGAELVEYTILHPDMWPEEIGHGTYAGIGRIQVVGAVLRKK